MKRIFIGALVCVMPLVGCISLPPRNAQGQQIKFVSPVLEDAAMSDARYVLIEKSVTDGKYKLISISKKRQNITNERQERIAFTKDLTGFAPDFSEYSFQIYTDNGNYGRQTAYMRCNKIPLKTENYDPCSSDFSDVFIPMGITKSYVAGRMSSANMQIWEDTQRNNMRAINSPLWALKQAGVFERLTELANPN